MCVLVIVFDTLEIVKDLTADGHGLGEGLAEEPLEGEAVSRVLSAVDHVGAGDGEEVGDQVAGNVGVVLP